MAIKRGVFCKLFRNTGTYGSPTWAEIKLVRDMVCNVADEEWDATCRAAGGQGQAEPSIRNTSLEGTLVWDSADTQVAAMLTAYLARTSLDMAALDGASSGAASQGPRALFKITQWKRNEGLRDGVTIDFVMKPCYEITNIPAWSTFA